MAFSIEGSVCITCHTNLYLGRVEKEEKQDCIQPAVCANLLRKTVLYITYSFCINLYYCTSYVASLHCSDDGDPCYRQTQRKPEGPAVTYATYRGSARIRQLLKNQSEMTEIGEEGTKNRNASMVKENGEIQTTVSPKSEHLIKGNGEDKDKDHQDDAVVNSSAFRMGRKKSSKLHHCLGSSNQEITAKAITSSTESSHEMDLEHTPALAAITVKKIYSLDSLLSSSSTNSDILTNSTSLITKMSSANDLVGKDGLLEEAKALFQVDKNVTSNFDKENNCGKTPKESRCSKTTNKKSTEEMQDDLLHSPKSKRNRVNEELWVNKGELCCNCQMDCHSELTLDVQMLHSNTSTFQHQADQHTGNANTDSDPRSCDTEKIVAAVEREQNPQNFPNIVLLPLNEQIPTCHSMKSKEEECIAVGNLTGSVSSIKNGEDRVTDRKTCSEDLNELGKPMNVQNDHQLIHVDNSKDTATQQTGLPCLETECVETMKVLPEAAAENLANVSSCIHECESVKCSLNELTEPLSVTYKPSFETGGCCSASLYPSCTLKKKTMGRREVSLRDVRETLSCPDLEYEKSKSFEQAEMSLSENYVPVPSHGPVSFETIQDVPAKALVVLAEKNTAKHVTSPLIIIDKTDDRTPAASKIDKTGMTEVAVVHSECKDCIFECSCHIFKSQEKNLESSYSTLGYDGRPLTNHCAFVCEKDIDVDIVSESPPISEDNCINFSSKKENSNKSKISPTVLDSSSDNRGKPHSPATNSENDQTARQSAISEQDGFVFAESRRIIPENRMTKVTVSSGDPRASCLAGSLELDLTSAMSDNSANGEDGRDVCIPRPTSPTLGSRVASNLPISAVETVGVAQGNSNSSCPRASDGTEEASSTQQFGSNILAEATPSPSSPSKSLELVSEPACTEIMCRNTAGQVGLGNWACDISEPSSVMDDQTAATSAESNELCSEEVWKHTDAKGQESAKFQDAAVLFKKAEEIVDSVLHLAIEEIITTQAISVCQLCESKDSLTNTDILSDQKAETVQLEAEVIQSTMQLLKHFNESSEGGSCSFTGNETVDTNNQDEKMLSYIPDKIDLHSALALKAEETAEEVNSAKQKLASTQWQNNKSKIPPEKTERKPDPETPKILNLDMKSPAKRQEPTEKEETWSVTVNCEKAERSALPFLPDSVENGLAWPQRGEEIQNSAFTCQTNEFLPTGSSERPESDLTSLAKERHNRKVCEHLAVAEMCGKAGVSATGRISDGSLHLIHRDAAVTEEMLLSLLLEDSCNDKNTVECTLPPSVHVNLSSSMPDEECVNMQSESKDKNSPQGSLENSAENSANEHCGKEAAQVKTTLEGSEATESKEGLAEGAHETAEVNTGSNAQIIVPELSVIGENSKGENCLKAAFAQNNENLKRVQMKYRDMKVNDQLKENDLDCSNYMKESTGHLPFSPLIEQWENSSFTIIYEGALQTETKSVSTDHLQTDSLPSSVLPSDNTDHLIDERAKNKHEPACFYGKDNKLNEGTDSHSSESFLNVEAKRYRVYPFSLSPIYEDDSSQEDLLSTDMSPEGCPSGVSKDNTDPTSVLSLLQSVSERLQFTTQLSQEEEEEEVEEEEESSCEENILDVEREDNYLSSQWRENLETTLQSHDQNRSSFPEQSLSLAKEQFNSKEQLGLFPDVAFPGQPPCKPVSQKADAGLKHPPTSVYYQYWKSASNCSSEKGTRFGSILQDMLQPKIPWSQDNAMPKLGELSAVRRCIT